MRYPKLGRVSDVERSEMMAIQRISDSAESELTQLTLRLEDFGRRQEAVRRRYAPLPAEPLN